MSIRLDGQPTVIEIKFSAVVSSHMARIETQDELEFDSPVLVEGLPGIGLVGKIATDHLVDTFDMSYYGAVYCEGIPNVTTYRAGNHTPRPPVRLYADDRRDLLALQSDVPVSPRVASEFATCLAGWFDTNDVTPLCLSGLPEEKDDIPALYGIATGEMETELDSIGIDPPDESGLISGPTGALLAESDKLGIDSVGLIVQANKQFPDPEAARVLLLEAVEPLTGVEVETETLVEQAEEIAQAREQLAKQMQQADEESSKAQPLGMYQ